MDPLTLDRLAQAVGATRPSRHGDRVVERASTDTRDLACGGQAAVFFALRGERFDGVAFLEQAFARGAAAAVVPLDAPSLGDERPLLRVPDVRAALGALAAAQREALGYRVVAVTGSAGKTTTKDMIHAVLSPGGGVIKAPGSFNNDVGVPVTLLAADRGTRAVVVEVGTNAPGEIAALARLVRPDVAVITCIGEAHLEGLGSIEGVAREKLSLLEHLRPGGAAVLNGDDVRLRGAASALAVARGREGVTLCGLSDGLDWSGTVCERGLRWRVSTRRRGRPGPSLELPLPGHHVVQDALLAIAAAERLGVDPRDAAAALARFSPPKGRWGVTRVLDVTLIDDTYNANPTSVTASLEAFASVAPPARRVVVLGSMHELGEAGPERHRAVGRWVARLGAARLITVGDGARQLADGARAAGLAAASVVHVDAADQVLGALADLLQPGMTVLFKASRACRLEQAVAAARDHLQAARPAAA